MVDFLGFKELAKEMAHIPIYLKELSLDEVLKQPLFIQMKKYPKLQFSDVYKFIYQGSCGWAHLSKLGDETQIKEYLKQELSEALSPKEHDEIFEILDYETGLGRVNLRSWKEYFGEEIDLLWELMKKAQHNTPTTTDLFIKRWGEFTEWIDKGVIRYPPEAEELVVNWISLIREIAVDVKIPVDLPLISHSVTYKNNYSPSYRLIIEEELFP